MQIELFYGAGLPMLLPTADFLVHLIIHEKYTFENIETDEGKSFDTGKYPLEPANTALKKPRQADDLDFLKVHACL